MKALILTRATKTNARGNECVIELIAVNISKLGHFLLSFRRKFSRRPCMIMHKLPTNIIAATCSVAYPYQQLFLLAS